MDAFTRSGLRAHSMLPTYRQHIEQAREIVAEALELAENPYVSWSVGGKDSSVMLHLVLVQKPDIEARVLASGETRYLFPEFDQIVEWWKTQYSALRVSLIETDRVWTGDMDFYTQRKAGRNDILKLLPTEKHDLVFLGLRNQESNRRRAANARGFIRQYADSRATNIRGTYACTPLARLTTKDVAAYVLRHKLPVFQIYLERGFEERTTLRMTGDAVRQMAFQRLRLSSPGQYNELLARFPELHWWNG